MTPIPNGSTPPAAAAGTKSESVPAAPLTEVPTPLPEVAVNPAPHLETPADAKTLAQEPSEPEGSGGMQDECAIHPAAHSNAQHDAAEPHDGTIEQTTGAAVGGVSASIPDDVWEAATVAYELYRADRQKPLLWQFAIAIMAERKRCAVACDVFDAPVSDSDFVNGQATAAQQIRHAIRKGA